MPEATNLLEPGRNSESLRTTMNKNRMISAMIQTKCRVSEALEIAEVSRTSHYWYMQDDPEYKRTIEAIAEYAIDHVEGKLFDIIDGVTVEKDSEAGPVVYKIPPNVSAIIFYLKCKGKKRGYIERSEQDIRLLTQSLNQPKMIIQREIIERAIVVDEKQNAG